MLHVGMDNFTAIVLAGTVILAGIAYLWGMKYYD